MTSAFYDLSYRSADEGEICNWEGDTAVEGCGEQGFAVLYLNSWRYEDKDFPFMKSCNEICLCKKHMLGLVSDLLGAGDLNASQVHQR